MERGNSGAEDLVARFEATVSGAELNDLRTSVWSTPSAAERPQLRRPPRPDVVTYRVRVELDESGPPIWRQLDLRSDLTLDRVHRVLQAAFDWLDYHLHRFSLGGGPFDDHSEVFLCPFDVEEGDDDGVLASEVRLDETLQEPGDVLTYLYDYGDMWQVNIRLEEVLDSDGRAAVCVDGDRAAPPEDCGHRLTAEALAEVLDDPTYFSVDAVNLALAAPNFVLTEAGINPSLVELAYRLSGTGADLDERLASLIEPAAELSGDSKASALSAFTWFLEHAAGDGLQLTAAGYLKPADVEVVAPLVPSMRDWIGKNNRESHSGPLLGFRETLQKIGLLRKYKGRLLTTKAGMKLVGDPDALWRYVARKLAEEKKERFATEANLLTLGHAATSLDGTLPLEEIAAALTSLDWRVAGQPIKRYDLYHFDHGILDILSNVGDPPPDRWYHDRISPEAVALAKTALRLP